MEEVRLLNVLIDVNVLLDVLLDRAPWVDQARKVWTAHHRRALVGHLAAHALPNIFYIARKIVGIQKARDAVHLCLQTFEVAPIGRAELELADSLPGSDLEDNLVLACAVLARLDAVVTRDPQGFVGSTIPVITPDELLARIPKGNAN